MEYSHPLEQIEDKTPAMDSEGRTRRMKGAYGYIPPVHPYVREETEIRQSRDRKRYLLVEEENIELEEANRIVEEEYNEWVRRNKPLLFKFTDFLIDIIEELER